MHIQTLMGLARSLRELDRPLAAAEAYASITRLDPSHPTAHYKRGALLRSVKGRSADALTSFEAHLKLKPNHATTKFWIAAITGDVAGMAAAPAQMVADLFDQYADHFEDHLITKLQYRTPEALRCGRGAHPTRCHS